MKTCFIIKINKKNNLRFNLSFCLNDQKQLNMIQPLSELKRVLLLFLDKTNEEELKSFAAAIYNKPM